MMNYKQRIALMLLSVGLLASCAVEVTDQDWPQFKKDNFRSGVVATNIDLTDLGEQWTYDPGQEPVPAWYGPAKEDAYVRSGPLPSMRDYDLSFYPIVVGESLFYGSSADDAVHCIDVNTSELKWSFTTGGPIHIAPTYYDGNLYVGSDDGYVYCINARSGSLEWKFSPTQEQKLRVLNNGRFISFFPVRTGVLIEDDIAYFGASLLPWKTSYVCAVDAHNGEVGSKGTYVKEYNTNTMTLEGSMASTGKVLIQPQGRIAPIFLNKQTGEVAGNLAGTGGCFVLITPDSTVVHPSTTRSIATAETSLSEEQPEFMSYQDGKEIVVYGNGSYVLNDNSLVAYDRQSKKVIWLRQNFKAHRIIIAGDILFAGGNDILEGISLKNGQTIWSSKVEGTIYSLSAANERIFASTSNGMIYAFGKGGKNGEYFAENLAKEPQIEELKKAEHQQETQELRSEIVVGPFVQPFSVDSVQITLQTAHPTKLALNWSDGNNSIDFTESTASTSHSFSMPVRKGLNYNYQFKNEDGRFAKYSFDNFFNFFTRQSPAIVAGGENAHNAVTDYLSSCGKLQGAGLSIVMGDEASNIAKELAIHTDFNVVYAESSQGDYDDFVEELQEVKSYSRKISALKVDNINALPILPEIVDLVWADSDIDADEVIRLIAPNQFAVITGVSDSQEWLNSSTLDWQVKTISFENERLVLQKNPIENIGVWSHQHGDIRNASYGGESLYGNNYTSDFETQWMGRPGARFITDRSGRKPAPLAINGRMFIQGLEKIAAVSVYNGSILWMKDMPGLMRMNIPRGSANWVADNDYIYVAQGSKALKIDQIDGEITNEITMKCDNQDDMDWGYIGMTDHLNENLLIGSTVVKDAEFTNFYGGGTEGWYDAWDGPSSYKVLSNRLFAQTTKGEALEWEYTPKGVVINPTIAAYDGKLMFVESRSANAESKKVGRGGDEIFKRTVLIALDITNGEVLYEKTLDIMAGKTVFFLVANSGKAVILASQSGKYQIQTFDVNSGEMVWEDSPNWFHGDHGGHMSKPAIAGNRLVVKPMIYNLQTGERESYNVAKAGHGCAHYALSDHSMFYRGGSCTVFSFETKNFSMWDRLRPDCWLSTIPAQGMILSPEAGGGCSCGLWYETSMVFAPLSRTPVAIIGHTDATKRDYMKESWGDYEPVASHNEFTDKLDIELRVKEGVDSPIYYTLDGSEPSKESKKYDGIFTINDSCEVKVAIFIEKGGKERYFTRSQQFNKVAPEPKE